MFSFGKYKSKNAEWLSWGTWKSITQLGRNINDNSSLTLFVGYLQPAFHFVLLDFFSVTTDEISSTVFVCIFWLFYCR